MKPSYDSSSYEEFCELQKHKGLDKKHWKDLPQMWADELKFREELEETLESIQNLKQKVQQAIPYFRSVYCSVDELDSKLIEIQDSGGIIKNIFPYSPVIIIIYASSAKLESCGGL